MQRVKRMFKKLMSKKQNGDSLFDPAPYPPPPPPPAGPGPGINII